MTLPTLRTPLTRDAGISIPLLCGAMYPCSNLALVAAVSAAGGLGIVQPVAMTAAHRHDFRDGLRLIRGMTTRPIGVNLPIDTTARARLDRTRRWLDISLEEGVRFFIASAGRPAWIVARVTSAGGKLYQDVTGRERALEALDAGVHGLVCVNAQAGGQAGHLDARALLYACGDTGLPLVCAGGIGGPGGFTASLSRGYAGVLMGTRFIATTECDAPDDYKQAILRARAEDIVLTERITGSPVAVINTKYVQRIGAKVGLVGRMLFKGTRTRHWMRSYYAERARRSLARDAHASIDRLEYWQAGKSVADIHEIEGAGDVVRRFASAAGDIWHGGEQARHRA